MSSKKLIKYKNNFFKDYLEFYGFLHREGNPTLYRCYRMFPPSKVFYIKAALEEKFNRKFTFKEIKEVLNDRSWQWRTPSQPPNEQEGLSSITPREQL